jgi:hypothetical protein
MLKIVPPSPVTPEESVVERVKRHPRPDGLLQCNRCGGRSLLTVRAGVFIKDGRPTRGTVIHKDICAICYQRGLIVPMLAELKPIK